MRRKPEVRLSVCPLIISPTSPETVGLNSILTYFRAHDVVHRTASVAFAQIGTVSRFILDMLRVKASFRETNIAQFADLRLLRLLRVLFWQAVLKF